MATKLKPLPKLKKRIRASRGKGPAAVIPIGDDHNDPPINGTAVSETIKRAVGGGGKSLITDAEIDALKPRQVNYMTADEKITILDMYGKGLGPMIIAKRLHRNHGVISRFLDKYRTTVPMARLQFQAGAEKLAQRVLKKANVEESMEVLDRIDVLPKKERTQAQAPSFSVMVAMPGDAKSGPPLPSAKEVNLAKTRKMVEAIEAGTADA